MLKRKNKANYKKTNHVYLTVTSGFTVKTVSGSSWPWSYGRWICNYLYNQCLSLLTLWVRIPIRARCTTLCDKVCLWLATGWWFSSNPPVSSTNKTDRYDITEILLKVAFNTIIRFQKIHNQNCFKVRHTLWYYLKGKLIWIYVFLLIYAHFII
jgi:hypothetical protein